VLSLLWLLSSLTNAKIRPDKHPKQPADHITSGYDSMNQQTPSYNRRPLARYGLLGGKGTLIVAYQARGV